MKFREGDGKRKVKAQLDLTPLIDVVFQLILFFMLSSTFVVQSTVNIQVPEALGATALEKRDLTVTLVYGEGGPDGRGPIFVDNIEISSMGQLSQKLADEKRARPDLMLLIRSDGRTETARLVKVLGIARSLGITNFGIAARPPSESEEG
ncbi:MAG TPA: biopolymer transporter ExbD [Candidatus Hydrogenedentes bacterium]|nr:biopolymer transporter ExbD [Candidatus Hydrogenedentota bacterium]HQH53041.1 biopolymer transporter ExbD [Candidatus Hydrogenedentota bacterium]HQM48449.1 biopolymer transporter ExbD [Candidatus Hydrogenedentota bacterium]